MDALPSKVIEFDLKEHQFRELSLEEFEIAPEQEHKVYWIHYNLNQKEDFPKIAQRLKLPLSVIEVCNEDDKIPKIFDDEFSVTIETECLISNALKNEQDIEFESLIIHLTPRFCFTAASVSIPALNVFINSLQKNLLYAKTSCFILFLMLDNVINDYSKVLLDFELISDQIDLKVREMPDDLYNEVINVKKQAMKTKRYVSAIRDTLMRISARKMPVISQECRRSLRNLFNHTQMICVQIDSMRDSLNSTLDQIDNALMQKMNRTMKVLTAFASIFLPLTLIAGIYGMNFNIPELHWRYGYFWALGLMLICGAILIFVFKKMKWI